ncbi:helix-turn-helix domain-containing protein [Mycobacterium avium]|uniref:helix-turn-helix domain-containing protein n=1 Tax=Mycobacterium avium TaxID=1764 RepID=UPI0015E1EAA7|nr:helix-turn-helix transcriptional regulator [Mycobacterium avium]
MAGKKSDIGPIGENVTKTVRRFREKRQLSYAELTRRLAAMGREIPPLGLRRIESGERKVDVDDLVALALAFNVSPLALLLPTDDGPVVPQGVSHRAEDVWNWARGGFPLTPEASLSPATVFDYMQSAHPFTDFSEFVEKLKSAKSIEDIFGALNQAEAQSGDDQ